MGWSGKKQPKRFAWTMAGAYGFVAVSPGRESDYKTGS
jgi:hypothetical protein